MTIDALLLKKLRGMGIVSVPHLGSFMLRYQSARLVKEEQISFVPPRYIVVYSPKIADANAFAQFVADEKKVSLEEANQLIYAFVSHIISARNNHEDCIIKGIGVFYSDGSFESVLTEYVPNTFGLPSFAIDKILDAERKREHEKPVRVAKNIGKTLFIASPILFGALLIPNILQLAHNPQFSSFFRQTTAPVDFSVPEMPRPQEFKQQEVASTDDEQMSSMEDNISSVEDVQKEPSVANVSNEDIAAVVDVNQEVAVQSTKNAEAKYYIIVGTFSVKANAEKMSKKLKDESYNSGVIADNDKSRVYVSAFTDKDEAEQYITALRESHTYEKAWVFTKES